MSASIDTTGLAHFSKSLRRAVTGDLQKAMVKNVQDTAPKIVSDMHRSAFTRIQRRAAESVGVHRERDGITLEGGRGAGLGAVLFDGGEYGGRKPRKVTYATRSPLGRAYVIRRRTTMQFLPHLGREGYFFWPTVRDWMPKLAKQQDEAISQVLG